jgi:hypothetical protein
MDKSNGTWSSINIFAQVKGSPFYLREQNFLNLDVMEAMT